MFPMSEYPQHLPPTMTSTDIDLYCLECGYNLRGLSGDPRRCPECGHLNPVGDLELPAGAISAQLRRMETNPAVCAGMALVMGIFFVLFAFAFVLSPRGTPPTEALCFMVPVAAATLIWIVCAVGFCNSCRGRPGWAGVLWLYHVYALGLCVIVGGLMLVPVIIYTVYIDRLSAGAYTGFIAAVGMALTITMLVIFSLGRRAHRRLKEVMQPLQREVAVTIAREVLRRRLTRRRVW
jgi:hypothetical protein